MTTKREMLLESLQAKSGQSARMPWQLYGVPFGGR